MATLQIQIEYCIIGGDLYCFCQESQYTKGSFYRVNTAFVRIKNEEFCFE